jgi:hypothetical protein
MKRNSMTTAVVLGIAATFACSAFAYAAPSNHDPTNVVQFDKGNEKLRANMLVPEIFKGSNLNVSVGNDGYVFAVATFNVEPWLTLAWLAPVQRPNCPLVQKSDVVGFHLVFAPMAWATPTERC